MMTANARITPRKVNFYFTFKFHNCLELFVPDVCNTSIQFQMKINYYSPWFVVQWIAKECTKIYNACATFYFLNLCFSGVLIDIAVMVCLSSPLILYFEECGRLFQTLVGDCKNNPGNNASPYLNILHRWWKMVMNFLLNDN